MLRIINDKDMHLIIGGCGANGEPCPPVSAFEHNNTTKGKSPAGTKPATPSTGTGVKPDASNAGH